jgi:hypothetical protein
MKRSSLKQYLFFYHNSNLELLCLLPSSVRNMEHREAIFSVEVKQTNHETKPLAHEFPPRSVTVAFAEPQNGHEAEHDETK